MKLVKRNKWQGSRHECKQEGVRNKSPNVGYNHEVSPPRSFVDDVAQLICSVRVSTLIIQQRNRTSNLYCVARWWASPSTAHCNGASCSHESSSGWEHLIICRRHRPLPPPGHPSDSRWSHSASSSGITVRLTLFSEARRSPFALPPLPPTAARCAAAIAVAVAVALAGNEMLVSDTRRIAVRGAPPFLEAPSSSIEGGSLYMMAEDAEPRSLCLGRGRRGRWFEK